MGALGCAAAALVVTRSGGGRYRMLGRGVAGAREEEWMGVGHGVGAGVHAIKLAQHGAGSGAGTAWSWAGGEAGTVWS